MERPAERLVAAVALPDVEAGFGARGGGDGLFGLDLERVVLQDVHGALEGLARALHINLGGELGGVGQDPNGSGQHFHESAVNGHVAVVAVLRVSEHALG